MIYFIIIVSYIFFGLAVLYGLHRLNVGWIGKGLVSTLILLMPFGDGFISKWIMWQFEKSNTPMGKIYNPIEYPGSVLWIDKVWPGFDQYSRRVMIEIYLDGIHLRKLALNDGEGKIYVYQGTPEIFISSTSLLDDFQKTQNKANNLVKKITILRNEGRNVTELSRELNERVRPEAAKKLKLYQFERKKVISAIIAKGKIYDFVDLEDNNLLNQFNYNIEIKEVPIDEWKKRFVWCDEIIIDDNRSHEIIAFSKRCLGYSSKFGVNPVRKSQPFYGGVRTGNYDAYGFDDLVLFGYSEMKGGLDTNRNKLER